MERDYAAVYLMEGCGPQFCLPASWTASAISSGHPRFLNICRSDQRDIWAAAASGAIDEAVASADVGAVLPMERAASHASSRPPLPDASLLDHPLSDTLDEYERVLISRALSMAAGNVADAPFFEAVQAKNVVFQIAGAQLGGCSE